VECRRSSDGIVFQPSIIVIKRAVDSGVSELGSELELIVPMGGKRAQYRVIAARDPKRVENPKDFGLALGPNKLSELEPKKMMFARENRDDKRSDILLAGHKPVQKFR